MKIPVVNLKEKLQNVERKARKENDIISNVYEILAKDSIKEEQIAHILQSSPKITQNKFNIDLLETDRIFHINSIQKICIDYRLRFLDSKYFKPEIPYEAICEIKQLEKDHNTTLDGFKIVAPAKLMKLESADDPLLFAPIGNGYYYLVHKWGSDLSGLRKALMYPFKTLGHMTITLLIISLFVTAMFSSKIPDNDSSMALILFLFNFKMIIGLAILFSFHIKFTPSDYMWNSKYYNG